MGKRDRLRKQAVIAGPEKPFRASPNKHKAIEPEATEPEATESQEPSASNKMIARIRKLKEQQGG